MATKKAAAETINVTIPKIETENLQVRIIGDSPFIMHKWAEKAKKEMLDKQTKQASKGKEAKDPEMDFYHSLYWLNDGINDSTTKEEYAELLKSGKARFGFPSVALKACAIDAGYQQGIIPKKTTAKGAFHIDDEFIEIEGTPDIREDMVKVGAQTKTADIRYRGEFKKWSAIVNIKYNKNAISAPQICNLINIGGFANGIGEWRPQRNGNYGRFHVATDGE